MWSYLRTYDPVKYISKAKVGEVTIDNLINAAKLMFAPNSIEHFTKLLTNSCRTFKVEQIGRTYATTRSKLYLLQEKFLERYNFLVEASELKDVKHYIRVINFKAGGFLNTWFDLIPTGAVESFQIMLVNKKFNTIDDFFRQYFLYSRGNIPTCLSG